MPENLFFNFLPMKDESLEKKDRVLKIMGGGGEVRGKELTRHEGKSLPKAYHKVLSTYGGSSLHSVWSLTASFS